MNLIKYLILGVTTTQLLSWSVSYACRRHSLHDPTLCPGDRVVTPENHKGRVLGVNDYQRTVSIDLDLYQRHYGYSVEDVFLGFGCVRSVCVGDRAVTPENHAGRIIGVNPYNNRVSIDLDQYYRHYDYAIEEIFVGFGCVGGVCVRDRVVTPSNHAGQVIGVNRYQGTVSVDLDNYLRNYDYDVRSLFVSKRCLDYGERSRGAYPWERSYQNDWESNFSMRRN